MQIRPATSADLPAINDIYNDAVEHATATFDLEPWTIQQRRAWLNEHAGNDRYPVLVAEVDGRVVGWASLSPFSDRKAYDITAESSVYVHSDFRGQGIGRTLFGAILDAGRAAGLHSVVGRVSADNAVSIALSESIGYETVGVIRHAGRKFGRLLDVHIMQIMLIDPEETT